MECFYYFLLGYLRVSNYVLRVPIYDVFGTRERHERQESHALQSFQVYRSTKHGEFQYIYFYTSENNIYI